MQNEKIYFHCNKQNKFGKFATDLFKENIRYV